jgi:hypothetical protein
MAGAQERCGTAKDYVVQARERARPGLSRSELYDIQTQLKLAIRYCPSMGDAWYYRHLFSKQLADQRDADYSLGKARENGSVALNQGNDPFAAQPVSPDTRIIASSTVREKWALVVGISNFGSRILPLKFPAKDASDFAAVLLDPAHGQFKQSNVRLLTDSEATTDKIKEGLNWLARNAGKDDLVVVFVSSHGSPRESDTAGVSYVVTYDTDASNPDRLYATALEMIEIVQALSLRVKAQRGVLFLDTCFSGVAASGFRNLNQESASGTGSDSARRSPNGAGSKALTADGSGVSASALSSINYTLGRVVITASQPDERSWESEKLKNGFFTYYLIEALRQNKGASIEQVYGYLKDRVPRQVQMEKGFSQMPMMSPAKPTLNIYLGGGPQSQ